MPLKRVLVLGGTSAARDLASGLLAQGFETTTSLAGVTQKPIKPEGDVRYGGFGGVDGLVDYLGQHRFAAIADATHPFAAQISTQAHAAASAASIPYVRLEQPPWTPGPDDRWIFVRSVEEAVRVLPEGARVLAAIGRKEIAAFFERADISGVARMIEMPSATVPSQWQIERARPPFSLESERALLRDNGITHVVAKNSGEILSFAKFVAARESNIPVVVIERPQKPDAIVEASVQAIIKKLQQALWP